MSNSWHAGFQRDDATGALLTSGGGGGVSGLLPAGDSFRADTARLATLKTAIANRANAPIRVLGLGDSIMEGDQNTVANRWINQLAGLLRTRYSSPGVGGGLGYTPVRYIASNTIVNPWSFTGTKTAMTSAGLGIARGYQISAGGTATLPFTGTSVDINYLVGSTGGNFTWSIDGSAAATINSTNATTQETFARVPAAPLASGAHTLVITNVTTNTFLLGATVYDGDEAKGWNFYEGAHAGAVSGDMIDVASSAFDAYRVVAPHLVLIEFGTNDWGVGSPIASRCSPRQLGENLRDLIAAARSAETNPSIILIEPAKRGASPGSAFKGPWSEYTQAIRRVAYDDGRVTLFDRQAVMGDQSTGVNPLVGADKVHPTAAGHAAIAAALDALIASA